MMGLQGGRKQKAKKLQMKFDAYLMMDPGILTFHKISDGFWRFSFSLLVIRCSWLLVWNYMFALECMLVMETWVCNLITPEQLACGLVDLAVVFQLVSNSGCLLGIHPLEQVFYFDG